MSAPATNVLPAPMNTIAVTASSRSAASKAPNDGLGHAGTERVDGRVVDGDDGDGVFDGGGDWTLTSLMGSG